MIELLNKKHKNGNTTTIKFNVTPTGKDIIVTFVESKFSDCCKYYKEPVLRAVFISRCKPLNAYYWADPTGEKLYKYISETFTEDSGTIEEIKKMSKQVDSISISVPTSMYAPFDGLSRQSEDFITKYMPLLVRVNGRSESEYFWDFKAIDESEVVNIAYQALVEGKIPSSYDKYIFRGVQKLHQQLFGDECCESTTEDFLSK